MENFDIKLLIIPLVIILLLVIFLIVYFVMKNKKKKQIKENQTRSENIILALGNKENIVSVDAKESRLNLVLQDNNLIDEIKLKELGVSSIVKTSKKTTLVVGRNASKEIEDFINMYQDNK